MARRNGFTLVEVTIALLILAILAAGVAISIAAPMANTRMRDVVGRIIQFDHNARDYARNQDRDLHLVIDPTEGTLTRVDPTEREQLGRPLRLGDGVKIATILTDDTEAHGNSIALPCSRAGWTRSYAIELHGPRGRRKWLLFAGLTGQCTEFEDETTLRTIWRQTSPRPDAR